MPRAFLLIYLQGPFLIVDASMNKLQRRDDAAQNYYIMMARRMLHYRTPAVLYRLNEGPEEEVSLEQHAAIIVASILRDSHVKLLIPLLI